MRMIIRDNIEQYMQELKSWLAETEDDGLEEMGEFFTARVSGYEEHMEIWEKAYQRMGELIPLESRKILDMGCGTGLERRKKYNIPADQFIHFDMPLTLEHETGLLKMAGFSKIEAVDSILGATIIWTGK